MATSKSQRIGIAIILAVTVIGTLGSFAVMVLAQDNQTKEAAKQQKELSDYQKKYEEYQKKVEAQTKEYSDKYYATFTRFNDRVGEFSLDDAQKGGLIKEDLLVGDGEEIKEDTKGISAYYMLWLPAGKVVQQSVDTTKKELQAPLAIDPDLKNASLVEGWKQGMVGMKMGGVRELTIPSDLAYKEQGKDDIPPNTPLKFIVMAVPTPPLIEQPEYPTSLLQSGGLYGN